MRSALGRLPTFYVACGPCYNHKPPPRGKRARYHCSWGRLVLVHLFHLTNTISLVKGKSDGAKKEGRAGEGKLGSEDRKRVVGRSEGKAHGVSL